jgi:hypothetical protein
MYRSGRGSRGVPVHNANIDMTVPTPSPVVICILLYYNYVELLFTHQINPPNTDNKMANNIPNEYFLGFSSGGLSGNF